MQREEYGRIAHAQDTHWWYRAMGELLRQEFGSHLASGRVIDVGSGPGAHSSWLAEHGTPIAIDFEPVALELHRAIHPVTPVAVGDVSHLPLASSTVDGVLCVGVIVHRSVTSPVAALTEMARVLRPGGVLCILEAGVRRLRRPHDRITHTARRLSLRDLTGYVEARDSTSTGQRARSPSWSLLRLSWRLSTCTGSRPRVTSLAAPLG